MSCFDSDATGHKQMRSAMSWPWTSGWGSDGLQEGSREVRTPASCPWWGHLVQHCPDLSLPSVRLGSFEVFLLPLALEVWCPQPSQASCLSTLTLASASLEALKRIAGIPATSSPDLLSPIPLLPLPFWKQAPSLHSIHPLLSRLITTKLHRPMAITVAGYKTLSLRTSNFPSYRSGYCRKEPGSCFF